MNRWLIWVVACLALCGCQIAGGPAAPASDEDCPSPNACDEPDWDARLPPGPLQGLAVSPVAYQPLKPGCPSTLQVMRWLHPIVFQTVRPDEAPDTAPDPSDWYCDPPEAPLQRAGRGGERQRLAHMDDPAARGD